MKDLLIGMVVGVVTGYVLRKMEDDGKFHCMHDHMHRFASKMKDEAVSLKDAGLDKVEYVADRVHQWPSRKRAKRTKEKAESEPSRFSVSYLWFICIIGMIYQNHTYDCNISLSFKYFPV